MQTYVRDRILTILSIAAISAVALVLLPEPHHWQALLIITILAGYTHYVIGGWYQWQGIQRRGSIREKRWCIMLALISGLGSAAILWAGYQAAFVLATLLYFILHGYSNEISLYERTVGRTANRFSILATMSVFLGTLCYGIGHPSWFFDAERTFIELAPATVHAYMLYDPIPQLALFIGTVVLFIAVAAQAFAWYRSPHLYQGIWFVSITTAVLVTLWHRPLPYLVLLTSILLYHFIIWFLFYYRSFRARDQKLLRSYLTQHAVVILGVVALALFVPGGSWLLDIRTFLVLTTIHITVSFLNDAPVRRFLRIS